MLALIPLAVLASATVTVFTCAVILDLLIGR